MKVREKSKNIRLARSQKLTVMAVIGILLASTVFAAIPVKATSSPQQTQLQQDVNALQAVGSTGVLAEIVDHGQSIRARAGVAKRGHNKPVPFDARFRTGSNTKTFVAATVLQLVGEGKISLEDSVDKWLPGVVTGNGYDGTKITVRHLLQHTSGIFDYTADDVMWATLSTKQGFLANRFRHYEPQEHIAVALTHPPAFVPGTQWSYSNTNYVIAGEIIQAVTGNTWDREVKKRIIKPLNLRETKSPGDNPTISGPNARAYNIFTSDPNNRIYTDTTLHNMTWIGAAGDFTTSTKDENRFLKALLTGKVLAPAQLAEMKNTFDLGGGVGYGLGILHQTYPCDNGTTVDFWGHTGGVVGYVTYVLATPDGSRSLTLSESTTSFSDEQFYTKDAEAAGTLLVNVFCGQNDTSIKQKPIAPAPKTITPSEMVKNLQRIR